MALRTGPNGWLLTHTTGDDDAFNARIRARIPKEGLAAAGNEYGEYYRAAAYKPHRVNGWLGEWRILADEREHQPHAGLKELQREQYLSGAWRARWRLYDTPDVERPADADVVRRWTAKWSPKLSPQHLFPTASANDTYVGVECPPIIAGVPGLEPLAVGLRYTKAQHDSIAAYSFTLAHQAGNLDELVAAIAKGPTARLCGHEDVNPMDRPAWDPGALRLSPWWDWSYVYVLVVKLAAGSTPSPRVA